VKRVTAVVSSAFVLLLAAGFMFLATPADAGQGIQPKLVQASRSMGILTIGGLTVGPPSDWSYWNRPPTLRDAIREFGRPRRVRRPYTESCNAYFGSGLMLVFTSFGLSGSCQGRSLQAGSITSRRWRVEVGSRVYGVGLPRRRIPRGARFWPGLGFQLASKPFIGRRTGTVFAKVGGRGRISRINLFIGGAGD
jgi:hypothetical protein